MRAAEDGGGIPYDGVRTDDNDNDAWVQLRIRIGIRIKVRLTSFCFMPVCWRRAVRTSSYCAVLCAVPCCAAPALLLVLTGRRMMGDDAGCGMRVACFERDMGESSIEPQFCQQGISNERMSERGRGMRAAARSVREEREIRVGDDGASEFGRVGSLSREESWC